MEVYQLLIAFLERCCEGRSITTLLVKRLLNDTDDYKKLSDQDLKLKLIAGSYTPQIRDIE